MTMKILDALKETGKAEHPDKPGKYVELKDDFLGWYHTITEIGAGMFSHSWYFKHGFKPYHEVKEIKPEKAGELWSNNGKRWFVAKCPSNEYFYDQTGVISHNEYAKATHGKNGWTRIFPKPEDESIERIEIEGVEWEDCKIENQELHAMVPLWRNMNPWIGKDLINKPPMKMILEIPKI
jgi:hypothetical protein